MVCGGGCSGLWWVVLVVCGGGCSGLWWWL